MFSHIVNIYNMLVTLNVFPTSFMYLVRGRGWKRKERFPSTLFGSIIRRGKEGREEKTKGKKTNILSKK